MFSGELSKEKCLLCDRRDTLDVKSKNPKFVGVVCYEHLLQVLNGKPVEARPPEK
jgi:hypothetical protein